MIGDGLVDGAAGKELWEFSTIAGSIGSRTCTKGALRRLNAGLVVLMEGQLSGISG
jgi:hypothetical protein